MEPRDIKLTINYRKKTITTDKLYQKLENKLDKDKLDKFISILDSLDKKQDQVVDFGNDNLQGVFNECLTSGESIDTDGSIKNGEFLHKNILKLFGYDISTEMELLANAIREIEEDEKNEFIANKSNIPSAILKKLAPDTEVKFEKTEEGYKVIDENGSYTIYNKEGSRLQSRWIEEDCSTLTYYDNDDNPIKSITKYNNGLTQTQEINENGYFDMREFGKTSCFYNESGMMEFITVNKGLPNETSFKIIYDEDYSVKNIISENDNPVIKFDELNKQVLIGLLNSDGIKEFGKNFDIKTEGSYINVHPFDDDN